MKRLAVFVEGQTEALFVRELLIAFAGTRGLSLYGEQQYGGQLHQTYQQVAEEPEFEVLIANCCCDGAVATQIRDRYANLEAAGYNLIVGLRDLYPLTHEELPLLESGMYSIMPTGKLPIHLAIAVAEIEAWFIEEITHFCRIDPKLTDTAIQDATGLDLSLRNAEALTCPADSLHLAYQVAGKAWGKSLKHVNRLLAALDLDYLYNNARQYSQSLDGFLTAIEGFMATPQQG